MTCEACGREYLDTLVHDDETGQERSLETNGLCLQCFMNGLKPYDKPSYRAFVLKAHEAGYEPWHYLGRFYYEGPAAEVEGTAKGLEAAQRLFREVGVELQVDNLGMGYVVYPR